MDKLVLSIELGAWDKAEMLASTVKTLVEQSDDDLKRQVLRLEMAIRKSNHDKSMDMYEKLKAALMERSRGILNRERKKNGSGIC